MRCAIWSRTALLLVAAAAYAADISDALRAASAPLAAGDVAGALKLLRDAASNADASFRIAHWLDQNGLASQALPFSTQARDGLPRRADVALLHGAILIAMGRHADAIPVLEPLLTIPNAPSRIRLLLAQAYLRAGQPAKAAAELRLELARHPQEPEIPVRLAFVHLSSGDRTQAQATLRSARTSDVYNAEALTRSMTELASAALSNGDADAASLVLDELEPLQMPEQMRLLRANLCQVQNRHEAAIELLASGRGAADSAQASLAMGLSHFHLGRFREALSWFQSALKIAPSLPAAEHYMGLTYANLGQYGEAQVCQARAVRAEPRNVVYRFHSAWTLIRLDRIEEAESQLRTAVLLNPQYAPAWNELGRLQLDRGKPEEAVRNLARAIEADARFDQPYLLLSTALRKMNRKADAEKCLERFRELKEQERVSRAAKKM